MIVGIGVDIVDIPRFERSLDRTPGLVDRLFAEAEKGLRTPSLAARYAAKEALIKALGGSDGIHWTEIEVARASGAAPRFSLSGSTAAVVASRGITTLHLSLSHDAGLAAAYVVAEAVPFGSPFEENDALRGASGPAAPRIAGFSSNRESAAGVGPAGAAAVGADERTDAEATP